VLLQQIQSVTAVTSLLVLLAFTSPAQAMVIDVNPLELDNSRLEVLFSEIVTVEERVYTLDLETVEIIFGDGVSGARLPAGDVVGGGGC